MRRYDDNSGEHIAKIIDTIVCGKHSAPLQFPCWSIYPDSGSRDPLPAICGGRAKKAGFNGNISESSYQVRRDLNRKPFPSKSSRSNPS